MNDSQKLTNDSQKLTNDSQKLTNGSERLMNGSWRLSNDFEEVSQSPSHLLEEFPWNLDYSRGDSQAVVPALNAQFSNARIPRCVVRERQLHSTHYR